jgi:pimeloyl-ACP methyl ester carboxylesterase
MTDRSSDHDRLLERSTPAPPPHGSVRSADGTKIAYWREGSGPTVLIVHGGGNYHGAWEPMLPLLAPSCTVVTMDRRGRGASGDTLPYAIEREFDDVAALADAIGPVCVLGHSFGTLIALEAALRTGAISSLILYEGWPDADEDLTVLPDYLPAIEELVAAGRYAESLEYGESPEEIAELRRDPHWSSWVSAQATFPREVRALYQFWTAYPAGSGRWRQLSIPILVLYGEQNPGRGLGAKRLAGSLRNSRIAELPGQGHRAYREGPAVLAAAVLPFLRSLRALAG